MLRNCRPGLGIELAGGSDPHACLRYAGAASPWCPLFDFSERSIRLSVADALSLTVPSSVLVIAALAGPAAAQTPVEVSHRVRARRLLRWMSPFMVHRVVFAAVPIGR
jgi:hypothetical protein